MVIFVIQFIGVGCYTLYPLAPKKDRTLKYVINIKNINEDDLFNRSFIWFNDLLNNYDKNIFHKDQDKNVIVANMYIKCEELRKWYDFINIYFVKFSLYYEIKDQKVNFEFNDITQNTLYPDGRSLPVSYGPSNKKELEEIDKLCIQPLVRSYEEDILERYYGYKVN